MGHVYLVEDGDYEDRHVVAICTSRETALSFRGSVTVFGLDDADISNVACWWHVSYLPGKVGVGYHKWTAVSWNDAGDNVRSPRWLQWEQGKNMPEDGRVDIASWACSKNDAILDAKSILKGTTVPVWVYDWKTHGSTQPWRQKGTGVPYP